jgi:AcrR family transcriptional regulator
MEKLQAASSSREALMEVAIEMLERDGVLSGLNLSEVAKRAGVTPANVYHFFGSKKGLLQSALRQALLELQDDVLGDGPRSRDPQRIFEILSSHPKARLLALLALDGDSGCESDVQLFPRTTATDTADSGTAENTNANATSSERELDLLFHLVQAGSVGYALFRESAARQIGVSVEELDARAKGMLDELLKLLTVGATDRAD